MGLLEWERAPSWQTNARGPFAGKQLGSLLPARDFEGQSDLKFISPTLAFGLPPSALDLIDICSTGPVASRDRP